MGDLENLDIELFIDEVKNHPELWDTANEIYFDRTKKRAAWIKICQSFVRGFDGMQEKEQTDIYDKITKKWKNLKDNFGKSTKKQAKSGQAATTAKKYIYARQLSFLQQAGASTETESSLGGDGQWHTDQPEVENYNLEEFKNNVNEEPEAKKPSKYNPRTKKRMKQNDLETTLIDFIKAPVQSAPIVQEVNADRAFFESMLPSIEKFTEDQKLDFRTEVLSIVKRMRNSVTGSDVQPISKKGKIQGKLQVCRERISSCGKQRAPHNHRKIKNEMIDDINEDIAGALYEEFISEEYLDSE